MKKKQSNRVKKATGLNRKAKLLTSGLTVCCFSLGASALPVYYDTTKPRPKVLVALQEQDELYRATGNVSVAPVDYDKEQNIKMQPSRLLKMKLEHAFARMYAGAAFGQDIYSVRFERFDYTHNYGADGAIMELFLGYRHDIYKQFFAGAELFIDSTTARNRDAFIFDQDIQWRQTNSRTTTAGLNVLAGMRLPSYDTAWVNVLLGATDLKHDNGHGLGGDDLSNNVSQVGASFTHWASITGVGVGFEADVTPRFFARMAYRYQGMLMPYGPPTVGNPKHYQYAGAEATFGAGWHFQENVNFQRYRTTISMEGLYAGLMLGQDSLISSTEHLHSDQIRYTFKSVNRSVLAGAYGGYFVPFSRFNLTSGFDHFGLGFDFTANTTSEGAAYRLENSPKTLSSFTGNVMLTYALVNNNHVYVKGGLSADYFQTPTPRVTGSSPKNAEGSAGNITKLGFQLGFGYETMVTEKIAVRSEYAMLFHGNHGFIDAGSGDNVDTYSFRVGKYTIGASYRFDKKLF